MKEGGSGGQEEFKELSKLGLLHEAVGDRIFDKILETKEDEQPKGEESKQEVEEGEYQTLPETLALSEEGASKEDEGTGPELHKHGEEGSLGESSPEKGEGSVEEEVKGES